MASTPFVHKNKGPMASMKKNSNGDSNTSDLNGKEEEKTKSSNKLPSKSITRPLSYIEWKGFEETSTTSCNNCALCGKDMAYLSIEEKLKNSNHKENDVAHMKWSINPEASILPCGHVFHSYCLLNTSIELTEPLCPICVRMM
ncbi:hypothetical protein TanjilG_27215 [Lupinus angustifolius]|uniref:RING-type domain-containing protein n=1 Tax=Lupinus angustifolius TaxID=3871 RepID=A0A1J7H4G4_LUPAN|nr:hypothetical protein TanjilG_27215 [Lupinus angustifolius]